MPQNDFSIANQGFPAFRADLNSALQALASNSSGATAPGTTYAYQFWYDTSNNVLKMRNAGNSGWIVIAAFDQTNNEFLIVKESAVNGSAIIPAGAAAERDGSPAAGYFRFNTDTSSFEGYDGTGWGAIGKPLFANTQFLTADKTLTATDDKDFLSCSAAITVTLPALQDGLVFGISNTSTTTPVAIVTPVTSTLVGEFEGGVLLNPLNEAILVCTGTNWQLIGANGQIRVNVVQFSASGTYVPPANLASFLVCANGATGGTRGGLNSAKGGSGGGGYSEKLFTLPLESSYSVVVGAGGAAGTAGDGGTGGTTTFDTISIPSSAGAGSSGTAGGVGSGGDFNATGGNGGNGSGVSGGGGGGGGGSATRAGNGGNGANASGDVGGGGGGTGGNNASGGTGGAAATTVSGSAFSLTDFVTATVFAAGENGNVTFGGSGASCYNANTGLTSIAIGDSVASSGKRGNPYSVTSGVAGSRGHITIVEFF